MKLYPWDKCVKTVIDLINQGAQCFQQFNCANCGAKQTIEEPNRFYAAGKCEECNQITNIEQDGMNYLVIFPAGTNIVHLFAEFKEK